MTNITLYEDIDQFVTLTHNTALKLNEYKNGGDALLLYIRYIQQRKMQNNSTTFSNDVFMINAMGWNKERFYKAKKILINNNLIISITRKTEEGKIEGHYIRVNFIITTHHENQTPEKAESGFLGTNTLVEKENTLIKKEIHKKTKINYLSLHTKTEQDIKDRIYEFYDKDIISKNISKYKLLVLFITQGYSLVVDSKEGCEKFFSDMIDKSNRYGYSSPGFADWDKLLLKAKEMFDWAEGAREIKNYMSTFNKFLTPKS